MPKRRDQLTAPLFPPESSWRPPDLADLPQDWSAFRRMCVDVETKDPQLGTLGPGVRRPGNHVTGICVALQDGPGFYLPVAHAGGDNVADPAAAWAYLRHQAARFDGDVVGANLGYDLDWLWENEVFFGPNATYKDVQVAEPLLDELQYAYGLDDILARRGLAGKDEALLRAAALEYGLDPKVDMWQLPARYVGPYGEGDGRRPLDLLAEQEKLIAEQELDRVWALECGVLPILVKMRRRGVLIDQDKLAQVERFANAHEARAWSEVQRHTGVSISVGDGFKAEVVAAALVAVDIVPPRTPSTDKPSLTAAWLEGVKHPAATAIRRARKMAKLRDTFVQSVKDHMTGGRVHCTFNQIRMQKEDGEEGGAAYGRLSCADPNMQQQPARDPEIGPLWRSVYIPDPGGLWGQNDYSQQEPRLACHYGCETQVGFDPWEISARASASAHAAAKLYWDDPNTDSHTMFTVMVKGIGVLSLPKDQFKVIRDQLKQTYLGICYGMGGPKLCRVLNLPTRYAEKNGVMKEVAGPEGQALLDEVDARVPYIRATARAVEAIAQRRGYVKTIMGRRLHFKRGTDGRYWDTHKGFNRIIQGSAADQTKLSMIAAEAEGAQLQLQVHDELDLTVATMEEGRRYARVMEECLPLRVPSKVDFEAGRSWGEVGEQ